MAWLTKTNLKTNHTVSYWQEKWEKVEKSQNRASIKTNSNSAKPNKLCLRSTMSMKENQEIQRENAHNGHTWALKQRWYNLLSAQTLLRHLICFLRSFSLSKLVFQALSSSLQPPSHLVFSLKNSLSYPLKTPRISKIPCVSFSSSLKSSSSLASSPL